MADYLSQLFFFGKIVHGIITLKNRVGLVPRDFFDAPILIAGSPGIGNEAVPEVVEVKICDTCLLASAGESFPWIADMNRISIIERGMVEPSPREAGALGKFLNLDPKDLQLGSKSIRLEIVK